MKKIYFLIILTVAIACNKSESVDSKKNTALAKVHRYDLDTNHFKVIKNKRRDELIYINEFGQKEISFEYDDKGLFDVNYFLYGKQVQRKTHFIKSDSLEVIYSIIQPAGHEFYFDRIYLESEKENPKSDLQILQDPNWIRVVEIGGKAWQNLKNAIKDKEEIAHMEGLENNYLQ